MSNLRRSLRNLPIFWKLLIPFLVLLLVIGSGGAYVIVRDLATKSATALNEQLTLRVLEARSIIHDRELYVLESANYAGNLQGMADAVRKRDSVALVRMLESVQALKGDLDGVAVVDGRGISLAELTRPGVGEPPARGAGTDWSGFTAVREAIGQDGAAKAAGIGRLGDRVLLVMVAPVCTAPSPCAPAGFAVAAVDIRKIAGDIAAQLGATAPDGREVTIYDTGGSVLASTTTPAPPAPRLGTSRTEILQRRMERRGEQMATGYVSFDLAGAPGGDVAVTVPSGTPLGSVRGAAAGFIGLLVMAMALAVAVGAAISGWITRQLRALVQTSRRLGSGELSARAPVFSEDEHGELAIALNRMAEQLEAEHATLELKVEQRTEEIRRLLRDRTEFFAGLSHELRTPLAVILAQAKMLAANDRQQGDSAEACGVIQASASQLLCLVNEILDLARAESGSVQLHLETVAVGDLLDELEPMLGRLGASSGVDVQVSTSPGLAPVTADAAKLREVVVNLVDNAIKYTPAGGAVQVGASTEAEHVRVVVSDTGVGIPEDVGDRVFEPFYLVTGTRPQRDQPASGLGLALARRWVEALGGTIGWRPRPSGGTEFSFTIPAAEAAEGGGNHRDGEQVRRRSRARRPRSTGEVALTSS